MATAALAATVTAAFRGNGGGPGYKKKEIEKLRNPLRALRYRAYLPEDADVRVVMAAFEAAADFESGDEGISSLPRTGSATLTC
ncbi:hypothetical protein DL768_007001 [Monosporascus sp. mg162]|nr:hypothetical protein DL768_007001 [Monosporascus sp. mg162]